MTQVIELAEKIQLLSLYNDCFMEGENDMQIKVYNEDGKVRVVKVASNGTEQTMFSNVADGEVAIIDVEVVNLSVQGNLDSISR